MILSITKLDDAGNFKVMVLKNYPKDGRYYPLRYDISSDTLLADTDTESEEVEVVEKMVWLNPEQSELIQKHIKYEMITTENGMEIAVPDLRNYVDEELL